MELLNSLFPNPGSSFPLLAVILGMPALGAFVNGIFGKRLGPAGVRLMALSSVGVSFAASSPQVSPRGGFRAKGEAGSHGAACAGSETSAGPSVRIAGIRAGPGFATGTGRCKRPPLAPEFERMSRRELTNS